MKRVIQVSIVCGLAVILGSAVGEAKVFKAPLKLASPDLGPLFEPTGQSLRVSVQDQRSDPTFVGGGIVGAKAEKGKGIFVAYASESRSEVADLLEGAARDAVGVLGFEVGEGPVLELVLKEFWADMYRFSGFSPMNCLGYVRIDVSLKSAQGETLLHKELKLTYFETTVPVNSMKEVSREAVSRLLMQAAWQSSAEVLLEHFDPQPDAAQIERTLKALDSDEKELDARRRIFWLALAGQSGSPVKDKLLHLLRTSDAQKVHQSAAEALGLLGVAEAREELEGILRGAKKGGWDLEDLEQVWYLMHSLALLGESSVSSLIPAGKIRMKSKLHDLAAFHEQGRIPEMTEAEKVKLSKAKDKAKKKIGGP